MSEKKKALIDLIEAYAASKMTQNETLQRMAIEKLNNFLAVVEVVEVQQPPVSKEVNTPVAPDAVENPANLM